METKCSWACCPQGFTLTDGDVHAHVVAPASDRAALDEPYPEPHLALAKLVLVAAVMAKLNVERVEYHETNGSCLGVLLHEPFWE